jgi:F0F1-type ATP synthase assembly protein I
MQKERNSITVVPQDNKVNLVIVRDEYLPGDPDNAEKNLTVRQRAESYKQSLVIVAGAVAGAGLHFINYADTTTPEQLILGVGLLGAATLMAKRGFEAVDNYFDIEAKLDAIRQWRTRREELRKKEEQVAIIDEVIPQENQPEVIFTQTREQQEEEPKDTSISSTSAALVDKTPPIRRSKAKTTASQKEVKTKDTKEIKTAPVRRGRAKTLTKEQKRVLELENLLSHLRWRSEVEDDYNDLLEAYKEFKGESSETPHICSENDCVFCLRGNKLTFI